MRITAMLKKLLTFGRDMKAHSERLARTAETRRPVAEPIRRQREERLRLSHNPPLVINGHSG